MSTSELLEAWREAARAAELAERLAASALHVVERAERDASVAQEIATLAEEAAASSARAAMAAHEAARTAVEQADGLRGAELQDADETVTLSRDVETEARERYHDAEQGARTRHDGDRR